jgi:peptide/nickel transport system permease protein
MTASTPQNSISQRLFQSLTGETAVYIFKRLLQGLLTLLLASMLCFLIIELAPGDFLDAVKESPTITKERLAQLRLELGLDCTWATSQMAWIKQAAWIPSDWRNGLADFSSTGLCWSRQYLLWLQNVVTKGDFSQSFALKRPVSELLMERVPATLLLAISSLVFTWAIGIPLGIIGAVKQQGWLDRFLRVISYVGQGFPSFITALLLLIFAQNTTPIFPVGGMTSTDHDNLTALGKILDIAWHMVLPTIALSLVGFAGLQRIARGEMLDVLRQDYIQTARAKGLPEDRVIYVHALRNAINPLVTLLGFEFASLLSGAFITEYFFGWPGLGRLTLQAVQSQDLYVLMASLMMGAAMLIIGNLLADILLKFVDPRINLSDMN